MDVDKAIDLLRGHGIPIDVSIVTEAFADEGQREEVERWAAQHLSRDNLLSCNELEQYAALEKAGKVESLAESADLSLVRPLPDHELRDAISELNRSTEAIRQHTDFLKQQQEALARLVRDHDKSFDQRVALQNNVRSEWDQEQRKAAVGLQEVSQRLQLAVDELVPGSDTASDTATALTADLLRFDDKLLTSLRKLGREIPAEDNQADGEIAKLRELCARLIKFDVEAIRARLDRTYLEALGRQDRAEAASSGELIALEEEVESLYAEILPVAQMAAQQQYLDPATRHSANRRRIEGVMSDKAFTYILACLDYLVDRAQRLTSCLEIHNAHREATARIVSTAKEELAVDVAPTQPKQPRRPTINGTSTRRRKSSSTTSTTSPVRLRSTQRRRSSGGVGIGADEAPIDVLLRDLAITLPAGAGDDSTVATAHASPSKARTDSHSSTQLSAISSILADRRAKVAETRRNVQTSFEASSSNQVADVRRALLLIRESILAETPYGPAELADQAVQSSIDFLAQGLDAMQSRMVDAERHKSKDGDARASPAKQDLIARWG